MPIDLAAVRRALDNDELEPCFQPVVELSTGRLTGFEVLARWKHPQLGLVLPENFISLAEEDGLIGRLMQQILRKAFLSSSFVPAPLVLAFNVSPSQLHEPDLPEQIRKAAEEGGFPLDRIAVEITESGLMENLLLAQKTARELKDMGCRLALDDFGTGYSSLLHLQALPFDVLKVDRSFVSSMTDKRESRKIVAAIVGLAHSLDLITIAEGIETEEQAELLLRLDCQLGQGWLYGRPLIADRITSMVESTPRLPRSHLTMDGDGWVSSSLEALPVQRLAQLQAIYDGAPVGLCFLDRNLRYVSINRRLAAMNGSPVESYLGRTVREMIPSVFPAVESYLLRALQGEVIEEMEFTRPANGPRTVDATNLVSYQPALDESGEVIGISVAVTDITERKRIQEALLESEDHLRYMVDLNTAVQWSMDSQGNVLDVNSGWVQLTGLSREKTRNLGWLEALHPDDVEPTMKALLEALRTGEAVDIEYRIRSVGDIWRWMRSRGAPRIGSAGQIIRWYGSTEDVGERRNPTIEHS
ncbi:MAG: EAL domain-containing protein [Terracidiphilus sp.]|jgi:PAS domain S-box-containing protein